MSKNIFNKITRVATSSPNLNLNDLLDVNTNTATNNQVLRYAGGTWVNSNDNGITSINLVMPNNTFDVIGSPLTSNGEIVVNYAVQAQNQFLATPISSSGQPSFRGIQLVDLPTLPSKNFYYDTIYTSTTVINPAVANTHYNLLFGGTITINPLNVGEHIMITSDSNTITVNFTGTSFVTNSYLGGGTSNPSFSLLYCTIELMCVFNTGQTYYHIVRVSQNRSGSICTLNGTKISALAQLDNIPNVNITTPSTNEVLTYNGTNWVNQNVSVPVTSVFGRTGAVTAQSGDYAFTQLSGISIIGVGTDQYLRYNGSNWSNANLSRFIYFSSSTNLTSGNYIGQANTNASRNNCKVMFPKNGYLISMKVKIAAAPGTGNSRTFQVYVNDAALTNFIVTISDSATTASVTPTPVVLAQYDDITILHTTSGAPTNAQGYATIEYY